MIPRCALVPWIILALWLVEASGGEAGSTPPRAAVTAPGGSLLGTRAGDAREVAGLKLRWCPSGRFRMGSPTGESGRRSDEGPVDVTLTRGFWIGQYEVTQAQWRRVMGSISREFDAGHGDHLPVYWVSFVEAEEFCRRLTEAAAPELPSGWEFRLPTEAQWEYACRAGTTSAFAFGDSLTKAEANFGRPFRGAPPGFPDGSATPVGTYPPNAWGIHDLHGNQWEWCRDYFHGSILGGVDPDRRDQPGSPNRDGSYSRVRRGGAWPEEARFCRSAARLPFEPERRSNHIGFRVVLVQR
ncbi:MAG: formylglycine-generating enzyme family protein [Verrucomicrobia bacterium]|nr:formylglycine-generating enzyme family protein [Verrucomicrobiota bacterium]